MIESLLEIQIAYSLMEVKTEDSTLHPIDTHYMKLNCSIDVINKYIITNRIISYFLHINFFEHSGNTFRYE
jgi:hypothetical protein